MKFLSLFSGIGGLDLGLERAGMTCVGQVEIDQFCCRVLAKHWPNVKRMNDIREVKGDEFGPIDCIAGGFPCQDVSRAGLQAGIKEGTRSGLWSEYCRLIRVVRPRIVIVENVPGLLDGGIGRVLGDLAESGFDAEWQCIPAASVGAPHIRDRVWLLAYPRQKCGTELRREKSLGGRDNMLPKGNDWYKTERREDRDLIEMVPGIHKRVAEDWWRSQSRMDRSADGIPDFVDRNSALGNAVVPQVAEVIGRAIMGS